MELAAHRGVAPLISLLPDAALEARFRRPVQVGAVDLDQGRHKLPDAFAGGAALGLERDLAGSRVIVDAAVGQARQQTGVMLEDVTEVGPDRLGGSIPASVNVVRKPVDERGALFEQSEIGGDDDRFAFHEFPFAPGGPGDDVPGGRPGSSGQSRLPVPSSAILAVEMATSKIHHVIRWALSAALGIAVGTVYAAAPSADSPSGEILEIRISSIIHPVAAAYLVDTLARADREGAAALVVELDTPGGLMTSMREMTTAMLGAKTPVIVYVAPEGARAASAGFFILQAADFAAMAPSTNTGAAHPVGAGGSDIKGTEGKKTEEDAAATMRAFATRRGRNVALAEEAVMKSRSFTAQEALDDKLIDAVAGNLPSLLKTLDGREFEKPAGTKRRLDLAGRPVQLVELTPFKRFLSRIADPNLASILLTIGLLGLYFELAHPGAVLPGVVGGICLLTAFFALSVLPVSYVGVALVILAVVLFVAEVKVASFGALAVGGIIALVLGLGMLFHSPEPALQVSRSLIAALALTAAIVVAGGIFLVTRAFRAPVAVGRVALLGERAVVRTALEPAGKVFVQGEWWNAVSDEAVAAGEEVEIVAVDGMTLRVRRPPTRS